MTVRAGALAAATLGAAALLSGCANLVFLLPKPEPAKVEAPPATLERAEYRVEEIFSAAKSEFKHLEFYYFHNCVYDFMWKNNRRRYSEKFATRDVIRKYNKDYKLIFVGDATMSPYEILQPGGSVEYNNEEAGAEWLQRLTNAFPKFAWINPEPPGVWQYRQSIAIVQQLMNQRMFPLSLAGLEGAMRLLSK